MKSANIRYLAASILVCLASCKKQTDHSSDVIRPLGPPVAPILHVVIEAETLADVDGKFAIGPAQGAAGSSALTVPAGIAKHGKIKGSAKLQAKLSEASMLRCWLRVKWTGTCSNSIIVKAPGIPQKIVGESATYHQWHWVKGPTFQAEPGPVSILLHAREDGVFIDQLMLTSDLERVPVGIEFALAPTLAPPIGDAHDGSK